MKVNKRYNFDVPDFDEAPGSVGVIFEHHGVFPIDLSHGEVGECWHRWREYGSSRIFSFVSDPVVRLIGSVIKKDDNIVLLLALVVKEFDKSLIVAATAVVEIEHTEAMPNIVFSVGEVTKALDVFTTPIYKRKPTKTSTMKSGSVLAISAVVDNGEPRCVETIFDLVIAKKGLSSSSDIVEQIRAQADKHTDTSSKED